MTGRLLGLIALIGSAWCDADAQPAAAEADRLVQVRFRGTDDRPLTIEGRVLTRAQDGGLLVEDRLGVLWTVSPDRLDSLTESDESFAPLPARDVGPGLFPELDRSFQVHRTRHYVLLFDTSRDYAEWCGGLFERLLGAFTRYWNRAGLELDEPEFPLVVVVLRNRTEFAEFATRDSGPHAADGFGYYSVRANRVVLFDLTAGTDDSGGRIADRLRKAPFNVATVVHEATHQIAFNSGLHTRYADNPLWLTEGMAMYFETPDLRSRSGWRTIGRKSPWRSAQMAEYLRAGRPDDSLETLIRSDARLTDSRQAENAYAEAWALNWFLIRTRRDDYVTYLRLVREKKRLIWDDPDTRVADFQRVFGDDLAALNTKFETWLRRQLR